MKRLLMVTVAALSLGGCGQSDARVGALETKLAAADARLAELETQGQTQAQGLKAAQAELAALKQGQDKLDRKLSDLPPPLTLAEVQAAVAAALDKRESTQPEPAKPPEKAAPEAGAEAKPALPADAKAKAEEARRKLADLLPGYYANLGDPQTRQKVNDLLWEADAETRKEVVAKLKALVADEPDNKHLRMALAEAMTSTFRDVKQGLEQGILASNIMKEAKKAQSIDPDYYDAVHFVAVFKANYPPGFPEFEGAKADLDKALSMQAKMTWEARFTEIYEAYGKWYLVQKKYDDALAITQAGLDKDARAENLIALKQRIEEARK
ncbi:hypothetical protein EDM80_15630 [bacterium]|nr:MAG: hypothetical protein EDM80_15630 [bacterium]RIK64719.1 MAG: hypothetical protein DCC64_03865 [Planctomycetota bacterium]